MRRFAFSVTLMIFVVFLLLVLLLVSNIFATFAVVTINKNKTMAKKKKMLKAKEPVKVRFKSLANGNQSSYLDIYQDGKRSYDFLKLYLVPEIDNEAKAKNANALKAANAIKAQRIIELANSKAGMTSVSSRSKMLLCDWLKVYDADQKRMGKHTAISIRQLSVVLKEYKGEKLTLRDVDKAFCVGFIDFLRNTYKTATGKPLKPVTIENYCACLNCALNAAVRAEVIAENPFAKVSATDKVKAQESTREYLSIEEIKAIIATPCKYDAVKQAYLFSVYCGLRISDVRALRWGQVAANGNQTHIEIVMQKTKAPLYLPLSQQAIKWMPERNGKADEERVFALPCHTTLNMILNRLAKDAGISKHITFHTARHTFATMMLTLGADLYTTSKLLGHTDVATTQIYAKIVNKKKDDAVNLVNGIF